MAHLRVEVHRGRRESPAGALGSGSGLFTLVDYARNIVETMLEAHDRFYVEQSDFERTIAIDSLGVGITEFDLSRERAMELYDSGRAAAEDFLNRGRSVPVTQGRTNATRKHSERQDVGVHA